MGGPQGGSSGVRREFVPGIGRGGMRRGERGGGPEGMMSFRLSGNKENNRPPPPPPQSSGSSSSSSHSRSWREDRPDPDGWITKVPRDTRSHRYHHHQQQQQQQHHQQQQQQSSQQNHQHNFYDNRSINRNSQPMVNGDHSPPHSPQPETVSHVETVPSKAPVVSKSNSKPEVKQLRPELPPEKETPLNNNNINNNDNDGEHKTSWAKMALASKDHMERLSAELKEKEEQERMKKLRTMKPVPKLPERVSLGRERGGEGKQPFRRDFFPRDRDKERDNNTSATTITTERAAREFRGGPERLPSSSLPFKPSREALVPKSPK